MHKLFTIVLLSAALFSCKQKKQESNTPTEPLAEQSTPTNTHIFGNYVDAGYAQKNEGYDWVSVSVRPGTDNTISISVRSRADKKKPTCTFDTKAFKIKDDQYECMVDGKRVNFTFSDSSITIASQDPADEGALYFYCSGGASLAGSYKKLNGDLDEKQIDPTLFSKVLRLQEVGFNVSSVKKKGITTLTVFTFGLSAQEYNESFEITGETVTDAEVEDLDSDGSPELFVYTLSDGSGSYGNVYAFSVNNKKSMSQVYFQPTAENEKISQGYMGHDLFAVVENRLVQRFPVYKEGDINADPTGGTRQVSYKLVKGEASKKLVADKISAY